MITLNSENGLTKVENWKQITEIPGFKPELDPAMVTLKAIIGRYVFKDKVRCGLTNCHTPHGRGYIVDTEEGYKTNIGKDCGKKYFGVDFEQMSRSFDRWLDEQNFRENLAGFTFRIDSIEERINLLRKADKGADWLNPLVKHADWPATIADKIHSMAKNRSNAVTIDRIASDEEVDRLSAASGRTISKPHYIPETIGILAGLEVFYPENDLRELIVLGIEKQLSAFKELDIDTMEYKELAFWSKWSGTVDDLFEKANAVVSLGGRFFTKDNLAVLGELLTDNQEKRQFREFLKNL